MSEQDITLRDVLRKALGENHEAHPKDINLINVDVGAGSNKGDNFICLLKRFKVTFNVRGGSPVKDVIIVKCVQKSGLWAKILKEVKVLLKLALNWP